MLSTSSIFFILEKILIYNRTNTNTSQMAEYAKTKRRIILKELGKISL